MDTTYRKEVKEQLDDVLLGMPGVKDGKAFGYPAFKVGRKIFCFVGGEGISIKLPEERVNELVGSQDGMSVFSPEEGTVWKAWLEIDLPDAEDYGKHVALYQESIKFVGEG
ncbi:MAG: MmcQ/YjbR family DNA-binding protein [Anaerolineae bacterium]|nr:MmcQ/YjbR family DNA-binding protein [Anaerolineae bacterium]MCA9887227.1 MmcQ/YjbR family DNA-binding protein [Anaerolineae bacterium]MCA9893419.1 MmcQ/YjbR family DNA-binding protein [Anaerolineae bacterium]MCB9461348.1 MmcQ/YjbR family DNA-binding protein [Anaerolineaceae bacterium]